MNEKRVYRPFEMKGISEKIRVTRDIFTDKVAKASGETLSFSVDISQAIGEISIDEAIQGVIDFFTEEMRKR